MKLDIRRCIKTDEKGIINVCFRTGFMGEDLTNTGRFNDKILFGYLFCAYYPRYEAENCFVAVDDNNIVGYVLCSPDSTKQGRLFILRLGWRIVLRILFYTSWKYPESFKTVLYFAFNAGYDKSLPEISREYPAHLHINVLPEYQHSGTGSLLIDALEEHLKNKKIKGIHLVTSNYNKKAIPFYIKKGFKILSRKKGRLWDRIDDYESIVFGEKLCN